MSNEQPRAGPLRRSISTGRLEALSDGVYAIALYYVIPFRRWSRIHLPRRPRRTARRRGAGTDQLGEGS